MNQHITRDHLSSELAEKTGMTATDARKAVDCVLDSIASHFAQGHGAELRGLGSFHLRLSRARPGRNPMKPEQRVQIPARWSIKFRPGKNVKAGLLALPVSERVSA